MDLNNLHESILTRSKQDMKLNKFHNYYNPYSDMHPKDSKDNYQFPTKYDIIPDLIEISYSKDKSKYGNKKPIHA